MINKPFDEITKDDIEALIENEVAEGKTLDYKQQLHGNSDADRKEFLYDVSSFANASGGDIIYGIVEKRDEAGKNTGTPEHVRGLPDVNIDEATRRLESSIQDGISPRIPGVQIKAVYGFTHPIIILRIPKSWNSPHMVVFQSVSRFYSRNSNRKYQLDVGEIRAAFAASSELPERIREFRADRISKIQAGETPIPLENRHTILLHVIPIEAFASKLSVEMQGIGKTLPELKALDGDPGIKRFNLDGLMTYPRAYADELVSCYTQLFRDGVIEAVDTYLLEPYEEEKRKLVPIFQLEDYLAKAIHNYLDLLRALRLNPPFLVMLSLLGVKDFVLYIEGRIGSRPRPTSHEIDRDILAIPDVLIGEFGADLKEALRPVFDALWQSAGAARSFSYDEQGNWIRSQNFAR